MLGNDAITHLYLRHIAALRGFLAARVGCREIAGELAHESFVRMMTCKNEAIADPRAFLFRVAGNLAVDHWRANPVGPDRFLDIDEHEHLASEAPGPERYAAARQQLDRLRRAVDGLPSRCREVFARHKFDGATQAEIATEFGISQNAVEKHLIRALVRLRRCLD
ncbi:MAG: RNA polymerase sigma factor [Rhodocyclaceae bacterium]|nr:RNA polymerase sigma factor [Rhodocyclaceae bacterium]